jgi:hypothetical protein
MNAGGIVRLSVACCGGLAIAAAAVGMLQPADPPDPAAAAPLPPRSAGAEASPEPRVASEPAAQRFEARRDRKLSDALGRFDETRLRDAGFSDRDIERLGERMLRLEREALAEREEAQRRGERPGQRRLSDRIWGELRAEYGDEIFATLLFAANQTNRVEVEAVAANSPAQSAGVLPGDVILFCDRQRIFSPQELRAVTRAGSAGSRGTVLLEVLREGRRVSFDLPANLLGARVAGRSVEPGTE